MRWLTVVLFALAAGLVTGILASIPSIKQTSLGDITVSYEWWLIFAFVIASNCTKNWESALKTFVFFLISQPLVFAVEVMVGALDIDRAMYFYTTIWGPVTLLTLPGGFIAYYIGKQNVLGSVVLGLGNAIQALMGVHYLAAVIANPPFHLVTAIVCFASIFVMLFQIQSNNRNRAISLLVTVAVSGTLVAYALMSGLTI